LFTITEYCKKQIQCILRTISEWNLAQGFLLHERSPTSLSGYIIPKVPLLNTILWVLLFWFGLGSSPFAGCFVQWSLPGFYHLFIYLHLISLSLAFKVSLQEQTQHLKILSTNFGSLLLATRQAPPIMNSQDWPFSVLKAKVQHRVN
jgi:hypothetical protein